MSLSIDASTPAVATNTAGTTTSASFTPPAGSILTVAWAGDTAAPPTVPPAPTITDNRGAHLTYDLQDWSNPGDAGNLGGQCAIWKAKTPAGTPVAMTVSVTNTSTKKAGALYIWVIDAAEQTSPVGLHGKNASGAASAVSQDYTAAGTGGWGFLVVCDWVGLGAETAASGCTMDATGSSVGAHTGISYAFARRTTADDTAGSTNNLGTVLLGSAKVSWVYVEIVPPLAVTVADAPSGARGGASAAGVAVQIADHPAGARAGASPATGGPVTSVQIADQPHGMRAAATPDGTTGAISTMRPAVDYLSIRFVAEADTPAAVLRYADQTYLAAAESLAAIGSGSANPGQLFDVWGYMRGGPSAYQWVMTPTLTQALLDELDAVPAGGWMSTSARATFRTNGETLMTAHHLSGPDMVALLADLYRAAAANADRAASDHPTGGARAGQSTTAIAAYAVAAADQPSGQIAGASPDTVTP